MITIAELLTGAAQKLKAKNHATLFVYSLINLCLPVATLRHLPLGFQVPFVRLLVVDFESYELEAVGIAASEDKHLIANRNGGRAITDSLKSSDLISRVFQIIFH